jgi:hypothetical protein
MRRTIRQTSIQAYTEIESKGLLSKVRWKVYEHLFNAGPLTGSELNHDLGGSGYHKRLSELEQLGVVYLAGKRTCNITGMECETWDVTATLPTGTVKSTSSRPSKAEFAAAMAELRVVHGERQQAGLPAFSITLVNVLGWVRDKYI